MADLTQIFSTKEIKEINLIKETCHDLTVNQEPVKCFTVLSDVLTHRINIDEIPNDELLATYAQLKLCNTTWKKIEWLDHRVLAKITPKVKILITSELNRRKSEIH